MIAALVVGLALAGPGAPAGAGNAQDTLVRVPGCALRLGWNHSRTSTLGSFPLGESSGGSETREGELRWFGYPAKVALTYRADRLDEVRLVSNTPSPRFVDYVPDELRRLGYRRTTQEGSVRNGTSRWEGEASIRLAISSGSVVAEISAREPGGHPAEPRPAALAPSPPGHPAEPGPATGESPAAAIESAPDSLLVDFTTLAPESLEVPRPLSAPPAPSRPRVAVEAGVFGRVQVRVTVGTAGTVEDARIERGIPELNHAALAWAGSLRFEPLLREGRPVRFTLLIPVAFLPTRPGRVPAGTAGEGGKP